jgi:hypothetical protein
MLAEDDGAIGQAQSPGEIVIGEVQLEKILDALVGRAAMLAEQSGLHSKAVENGFGNGCELNVPVSNAGEAASQKLQVDLSKPLLSRAGRRGSLTVVGQAQQTLQIHRTVLPRSLGAVGGLFTKTDELSTVN